MWSQAPDWPSFWQKPARDFTPALLYGKKIKLKAQCCLLEAWLQILSILALCIPWVWDYPQKLLDMGWVSVCSISSILASIALKNLDGARLNHIHECSFVNNIDDNLRSSVFLNCFQIWMEKGCGYHPKRKTPQHITLYHIYHSFWPLEHTLVCQSPINCDFQN